MTVSRSRAGRLMVADSNLLERMAFTGTWRDYQRRVLDEVDPLLTDKRLHVVAAPGSGKTVLGLELMRRIGRPALVLAPTRTIRDQWPSRLVPLFLAEKPHPADLSFDLGAPAFMTAVTYQSLHGFWADEDKLRYSKLLTDLQAMGPVTLILDEAHHLRREWWNALSALTDGLPEIRIVALTATPPHDAPSAEWGRYEAMCGPIDLEIGAPELVRNGDLSPHQDHVYFSTPGHEALDLLDRRRRGLAAIQGQLRADDALLDLLESHPWLADPEPNVEAILEAPEMLSAVLVHLAASGRKPPKAALALLGIRRRGVPPSSPFWLDVLLNGFLFRFPDVFPIGPERVRDLKSSLNAHGLIEGGKVKLTESRSLFTLMAGGLGKLDSIAEIARAEASSLGSDLRMVVLTDHVRASDLTQVSSPNYRAAKLGVVPIFETLRRAAIADQRLGVLTGTLIILPLGIEEALKDVSAQLGIAPSDLQLSDLPACPGYVRLSATGEGERRSVEVVTALFTEGHITILTGTQALLGEGWDAPAVNSLVLASNSTAYMLSNQMRGRAIRIDPNRPDKVANIWHLATIEKLPANLVAELNEWLNWRGLEEGDQFSSDLALLDRRFRTFEGVSNGESVAIENGLGRLGLSGAIGQEQSNARTLALAHDRQATAQTWRRSLGGASPLARVHETASPNYAPRILAWADTLRWLIVSAISAAIFAAADALQGYDTFASLALLGMTAAGAAFIAAVPFLLRACWLFARNGSVEGSLHQVGRVVLLSLHKAGLMSDSELQMARFTVNIADTGRYDIVLRGVPRAIERVALEALAEILGPVQNPRYLMVRTSWLRWLKRTDYHAVPAAIGRRKEWAEYFHRQWERHVGTSRLVHARTPEGRITLLRARAKSFAAGFQRIVDRRSAWM